MREEEWEKLVEEIARRKFTQYVELAKKDSTKIRHFVLSRCAVGPKSWLRKILAAQLCERPVRNEEDFDREMTRVQLNLADPIETSKEVIELLEEIARAQLKGIGLMVRKVCEKGDTAVLFLVDEYFVARRARLLPKEELFWLTPTLASLYLEEIAPANADTLKDVLVEIL